MCAGNAFYFIVSATPIFLKPCRIPVDPGFDDWRIEPQNTGGRAGHPAVSVGI